MRKIDLTKKRFGRLTVIKECGYAIRPSGCKEIKWECLCDCGNITQVCGGELRAGNTKSCGCIAKENASKRLKKFNKFIRHDGYISGYTTKGEEFLVDEIDYMLVKQFCWFINSTGYCYAKSGNKHILMHRLILGCTDEPCVDHKNGNKIDNRRENIRIVSDSINNMNKGLQSNNKSGCKGVFWHKRDLIWESYISLNKKQFYLGRFTKYEDAVRARLTAENKMFGQYAKQYPLQIKERFNGI